MLKKVLLALFLISQCLYSLDIKISNQSIHSHIQITQGIKILIEHSHVESSLTLFCQISIIKNEDLFINKPIFNDIKIPKKTLRVKIFRPPIS